MFGLYRTILALHVMAYHILKVPAIGPYAVYSFFVLSGFLMTTIMQNSYGYSANGFKRYAMNRFLRLYPVYWTLIAITCVIIAFVVGDAFAKEYHHSLAIPSDITQTFYNIFMVFPAFEPITVEPRLSPATWAITIELFFYLLIGLGLSRNKKVTLIWLALSLIYTFYPLAMGRFDIGYGNVMNASLPFALGASIYFYKEEIFRLLSGIRLDSIPVVVVLFVSNIVVVVYTYYALADKWWAINYMGAVANMMLSVVMVVVLHQRGKEFFSRHTDRFLGDFSYPLYLFHWAAAMLVAYTLYDAPVLGQSTSGVIVFSVALVLTLLISYVVNVFVNDKIEVIRGRIKMVR